MDIRQFPWFAHPRHRRARPGRLPFRVFWLTLAGALAGAAIVLAWDLAPAGRWPWIWLK